MATIKFALCGCGRVANKWLKAFDENPEAELIAIADPDPLAKKNIRNTKYEQIPFYSTIEQIYSDLKPDATIILTPPQYHSRYIQEAIDNNNHVMVEKPMCTDLNQFYYLNKYNEIAKTKKLQFAINQQYRWNPRIEAIRKAVQEQMIGDVFLVHSKLNQNDYDFTGWWRKQLRYISLFNWYVHPIDTMRYYLNQKPIEVDAKFIRPPHSAILGYSTMILNVQFEKTHWTFVANQEGKHGYTDSGHTSLVMYGTKGSLINTKNRAPEVYLEDNKPIELGENIANIDNAYKYPPGWGESLRKFIYSIKNNVPHPTNFDDNKYTMAIVFAAIKSFEERRIVKISEIMEVLEEKKI